MKPHLSILFFVVLLSTTSALAGPSERRVREAESPISVDYPGLGALKSYFGHGTMDDSYTWDRATWASLERRVSVMFATAEPWSGFNTSISIGQEVRGLKVFGDAQLSFHRT